MTDPLFARADLAIEESLHLRRSSRVLKSQFDHERETLRVAVFESAMLRSESKAYRDDKAEAF
ncbi:hypothetical protein [Bradyrhizobium sp.]|uniref:hypothetical protein n=1 Tax=Bradyrhizobium sp. TaxID=376 RepID=UPI002D4E249C|nr:hypothetical protein [Bradyrhizobium sp.]HZR72623.1 hypothetical protein [Bradyrhizobium sp.]